MMTNRNAGRRRIHPLLALSAKAAPLAALLVYPAATFAAPLKERAQVAPAPLVSRALPVNARWIQLYLPEKAYNAAAVENKLNYTITSPNDPAFAGAGVKAEAVQHRHFPESAPYADAPAFGDPVKLTMIYRVYVKTPKAMTEGKTYTVTPAGTVNVGGPYTFVWNGATPNEAIHVNQVAYLAGGPKIAYLSAWTGQGTVDFGASPTFQVINEATNTQVFSGPVKLDVLAAQEPWSKSNVYSMDFTALSASGKYRIRVPGVGSSFSFRIGKDAFNQIGYTLLRGLTMQRDGAHGLDSASVTHWARPPAHLDDGIVESTGLKVDLVGGHMDAGDRGKYPHNMADASGSMLSAIRLFPNEAVLLGETLQIPESTNGIPDLIDEAVYELDFLYKAVMNTPKDGTLPFYLRPQNPDGSGGYEAGIGLQGKPNRKLYDKTQGPNRSETLYAAGVLAMAYNTPLMKQYVPAKCAGYLTAAKRAFKGFMDHNANASYFKDVGWYDPFQAGPTPWADEMLVAATNLLEATGDVAYLPPLKAAMPADLTAVKRWGWQLAGPWLTAFVSLYYATSPALAQGIPGIKAKAEAAIINWGDWTIGLPGKPHAAPFGAPLPSSVYNAVGWYFSGDQTAYPAMVAYGVTHNTKYRDVIVKTWNYLLGGNALSRTYISGLGDPQRSPRWQVHEIGHYQWQKYKAGDPSGWSEIVPGIPSADIQNGNYDWFIDLPYNVARKTNRFPAIADYPALYRYHDSWSTTNESTIERMTRGAVSVMPLIADPALAAVEPPSDSATDGAGGAPPEDVPSAEDGAGGDNAVDTESVESDDGIGGAPAASEDDDALGASDTNGMDADEQAGCTLNGATTSKGALGWLAAASLLALARLTRRSGRAGSQ